MIKLLFAALLALATTTPAFAVARPSLHLAPPQYDETYSGRIHLVVRTVSEIGRICGRDAWACTYGDDEKRGVCTVYLPRVDNRMINHEGFAGLLRHEKSHCAGWPAHHPGSRYPGSLKKRLRSEDDIRIVNDRGGSVYDYYARYYAGWQAGKRLVIDGICASACTMALAFDNTCVTPRARLGFHLAYYPLGRVKITSRAGSAYMLERYTPGVRAWLKRRGGLAHDMKWLVGAELARLVKAC
jgi:hypothetical protein